MAEFGIAVRQVVVLLFAKLDCEIGSGRFCWQQFQSGFVTPSNAERGRNRPWLVCLRRRCLGLSSPAFSDDCLQKLTLTQRYHSPLLKRRKSLVRTAYVDARWRQGNLNKNVRHHIGGLKMKRKQKEVLEQGFNNHRVHPSSALAQRPIELCGPRHNLEIDLWP